jgi:hypothetical protein
MYVIKVIVDSGIVLSRQRIPRGLCCHRYYKCKFTECVSQFAVTLMAADSAKQGHR